MSKDVIVTNTLLNFIDAIIIPATVLVALWYGWYMRGINDRQSDD